MRTNTNFRTVQAADGTRIAYGVEGRGPALVLTNGLTTTTTFWKYLRPAWRERHTIITWDLPGHGRSGPAMSAAGAGIAAQADTLARIMDAAGVPQATQVGFSVGCQITFEMFRQHPDRCESLVAILGTAGQVLKTAAAPIGGPGLSGLLHYTPAQLFAPAFRLLARGATLSASSRLAQLLGLLGKALAPEDMRDIVEHLALLDPLTLQVMACSAAAHSAHDVLPSIDRPLLIVAGDLDPFAPAELVGLPLHRSVKGSELLRLPEGTHTALLEHPESIARAVDAFIARHARREMKVG